MLLVMKHRVAQVEERVYRYIAWRLPRKLVHWASIRLMAHATIVWPTRTPDEVSIMDSLNAWELIPVPTEEK